MNEGNDRGYDEPGPGDIDIEVTDHLDGTTIETNLLLGFAQGGIHRPFVRRLDVPAGKADLPRMVGEVSGPPGQQHRQPIGAIDQRDEHRRRLQGAERLHAVVEIVVAPLAAGIDRHDRMIRHLTATGKPADDPVAQWRRSHESASNDPRTKKWPALHTPKRRCPSTVSSTPRPTSS